MRNLDINTYALDAYGGDRRHFSLHNKQPRTFPLIYNRSIVKRMWTRLPFLLMLGLVSAKPVPEISLQEIEKELQELTAKEHDTSETTVKKTDQADTPKETKSDVATKEETNSEESLIKSSLDATEKKEVEVKSDAETERKKSDYLEVPPRKPVKPGPPEIPHRDAAKYDFKNSEAYRRLIEARNSRLLSQLREDYDNEYPPPPFKRPNFPEAPHRRTYDTYRKNYDYIPKDLYAPWDRTGFESNSDSSAGMRGMPYDMTRAERMALLSGGKWLPDVDTRSYNSFHGKMDEKETEDLIRGKEGLTETEKRKRLLTDLLAEKLKSKVSEAHNRGIEIPSKIQEFLWNYEARRTSDTRSEKDRLSH
nr:uncharacterized protein LOC131790679 isoform X2 [Pocillopora verrucosa]